MTTAAVASALLAALVAALAVALGAAPVRQLPPARPPGTGRDRPRTGPLTLRVVGTVGAASAAALLVPGLPGMLGALLAAAVVWWRSSTWEGAAVRRRRASLEAELPHVVDLLVAALHAGADPTDALERVAAVVDNPMKEELGGWLARLRLGADPVTVWSGMARHPQLGRLGTTLARSSYSGAPVAEALGRLADELSERARTEVESRVRQVEVKAAVPLGVCLLPAFVVLGVVPLVAGAASQLLG
jgi:Flp pilus assembly protein TadB